MGNADLLRQIYADPPLVFEHLHPDFVCHSAGRNPLAGTFVGADGFARHLAQIQALSDNSFRMDGPDSVIADEQWALVVTRISGARGGKEIRCRGLGLWRIEQGKLAEHWEVVSDQALWDDFWS